MDRFRRRVRNIIRNKGKAAIATTPVITTLAADPHPVIVIEELNRIFCTVCANLCFNSGIEDGDWQDWTEFMSLRQSAENGCVGCCLLVQAVRLLYSHDFDGERGKVEWAERRHLQREGKTIPRVWRYSIWDPTFPFAPLHHVFELFTLPDAMKLFPALATSQRISGTSEGRLDWAKRTLQHCLANHSRCNAQVGPRTLPSRIIDVQSEPVRLCESQDDVGSYICLSHCWGSVMPVCRTTIRRLKRNKEGIDWKLLPKTFQDAIIITRKLKVRYLWIDSICIIQDDEEDWRSEAAKMAGIYAGSLITISATAAEHDDQGFISTAREWMDGTKISVRTKDEVPYDIYVRHKSSHYPDFSPGIPEDDYKPNAIRLLSRGWVYQERLLSSRLLRFDKLEMIWECKENTTCECMQFPTSRTLRNDYYANPLKSSIKVEHAKAFESAIDDPALCAKRWRQIVVEYSDLSLTKEEDKLVALAGLAQEMKLYRLDELYLAGMWEKSLFSDMLWELFEGFVGYKHSVVWSRPSWSWLSVTGGIHYCEEVERVTLVFPQLLKVSGDLENTFVAGAETLALTLQGQLLSTKICHSLSKRSTTTLRGEYYYRWDEKEDDLREALPKDSTIYCLRVAQTLTRRTPKLVKSEFYLLLGRSNQQISAYSRLGIVLAVFENGNKSPFEGIEHRTITLV